MKMIEVDHRQRVGEQQIDDVVAYLEAATTLVVAAGYESDVIDPTRAPTVPIGVATDGTYAWPLALCYYVKQHGLGLPLELLRHMQSRDFAAPVLDSSAVAALRQRLRDMTSSSSESTRSVDEIPEGAEAGDDAWT